MTTREYTAADEKFISTAQSIANRAHAGVLDDNGDPYFMHPLAVAMLVRNDRHSAEAIALAFLHDVVEDTHWSLDDVRFEMSLVADETGHDVDALIESLDAISKRKNEPRVEYYKRILASVLAHIVKEYDMRHNTWPERLARLADDVRVRRTEKYRKGQDFLGYERTV